MRPRTFARVFASGVALLVATVTMVGATEWTPAVRLSPPGVQSWFPDVATDIAGGVHAFWSHGNAQYPRYDAIVYCTPTAQGCATTTDVQRRYGEDGNYVTRPNAVVDRNGMVHLIWRRKSAICHTTAELPGSLGESSWTRLRRVGSGTTNTISIDSKGTLHVAWSEQIFGARNGPCFGCADILYSQSKDSGEVWSPAVNISRTVGGSEKPHLAFGDDGWVYVAWEEGRDHYVGRGEPQSSMFSASSDGGRTWSAPTTFSLPDDTPQAIALGVDGAGRIVVVWQQVGGDGVFFQTSADHGRTWTPAAAIDGVLRRSLRNPLDDYDMTADAAGHLHVVLTGRSYESQSVVHLEWDGRAWSAPNMLYETDGTPEWTRIAVGNGNQLHAVWFVRPKGTEWNSETGEYSVWYARGLSTAPAIAPIAWPARRPVWLTLAPWLRVMQALAGILIVAGTIRMARRRGW